MRIKENEDGLYLFVDIDDFLVRSSPLIQEQVNSKTGFKTETLQMLEQTKRNCSYFHRYVMEEYAKAHDEKSMPNLAPFVFEGIGLGGVNPVYFKNISDEEWSTIKRKLELFLNNIDNAATKILNQYFEERDFFLENDNLQRGEIIHLNLEKEHAIIDSFSELLIDYLPLLVKVNDFAAIEVERIVDVAKSRNVGNSLIIPDYRELIRMDSNDIIKTNSISQDASKEYILYDKPDEVIQKCARDKKLFYDIITNGRVFETRSNELIDYNSIYQRCNVNFGAVYLVQKLINSGRFLGVYALSHHNGTRELNAKTKLIHDILPQLEFIGLRFHLMEHDGERRERSSKLDEIIRRGFDPTRCVLLDDSPVNCKVWKQGNGIQILYKQMTDSELINGGNLQRSSLDRITSFSYSAVVDILDEKIANLRKNRLVKAKSIFGGYDG